MNKYLWLIIGAFLSATVFADTCPESETVSCDGSICQSGRWKGIDPKTGPIDKFQQVFFDQTLSCPTEDSCILTTNSNWCMYSVKNSTDVIKLSLPSVPGMLTPIDGAWKTTSESVGYRTTRYTFTCNSDSAASSCSFRLDPVQTQLQ